MTTTNTTEKVRENRLRRMADRQGLALRKSPRRDPRALDYGVYRLVAGKNRVVAESKDLDAIEDYLTREPA
jgi:hypothetical protein